MTEKELNEYALRLAENGLQRGFDTEAYICRYIALKSLEKQSERRDRVPSSNVDEQIEDINDYFVAYMKNSTIENWSALLCMICQMLGELVRLGTTNEQKKEFEKFVAKISHML